MTDAATLRNQVLDRNGDLISSSNDVPGPPAGRLVCNGQTEHDFGSDGTCNYCGARRHGASISDVRNGSVKLVSTEEKKANTPSESILGKAHRAVHQERGPLYGHPMDNHGTTAAMFTAYLRRKYGLTFTLDADDICWFNIFQKASRDAHEPAEDNLTDTAGYAHNIELIRAKRDS